MALTISVTRRITLPQAPTLIHGTITFDTSYPTGGEAIVAADLKFTTLDDIWVFPAEDSVSGDGYVPVWNGTNLLLYESGTTGAGLDEVPDTEDKSGVVCRFMALGLS
jgi:hypothetical protein